MLTEVQSLRTETQSLRAENQALRLQMTQLVTQGLPMQQVQEVTQPQPTPRSKPPVGMPAHYGGKVEQSLAQCELYTRVRQSEFPNNSVKLAFIISLLEGEAAQWTTLRLLRNDPVLIQYTAFVNAMAKIFRDPQHKKTVSRQLGRLKLEKHKFAYNNSVRASMQQTPSFAILGYHLCTFAHPSVSPVVPVVAEFV
ncbi:protein LDOC1-like [Rhineura floridana]|uniref:protein LDOC1-like n=1 Tax=Rhineura floridana TaxID=261503 RepID=UPI002AC87385|nr:protein LDOC1-like [Rhineura floridana]